MLENTLNPTLPLEILYTALKHSYDEICIVDAEGYVVYENREWPEKYGASANQLVGMHISRVSQELCDHSVTEKVFREKQTVHMLQKALSTDTTYLVSAVPLLDNQNNIRYVITTSRDLSLYKNCMSFNVVEDENINTKTAKERIQSLLDKFGYIARSECMHQVLKKVERLARVNSTILITGESGTGKSALATVVHRLGLRATGSIISVNCAAIPSELLESELFGYEPGAFTGAGRKGKPGLFELASGGTLFLDEICELSLPLQSKLLGVLQNMRIRKVGGTKEIPVDVRLICATNCDLEKMVNNKFFREDLYYRINVLRISMPSLRERQEDFIHILEYILNELNTKYDRNCFLSSKALYCLQQHTWPGNIRELENILESLVVMSSESMLTTNDLPHYLIKTEENVSQIDGNSYDAMMEKSSHDLIVNAVKKYKTSYRVAQELGLSQSKASRLIRKHCPSSSLY